MLSKEQLEDATKCEEIECTGCRIDAEHKEIVKCIPELAKTALELYKFFEQVKSYEDKIEAQQQEIEDWKQMSTIVSNNNKEHKSQNSAMREALEQAREAISDVMTLLGSHYDGQYADITLWRGLDAINSIEAIDKVLNQSDNSISVDSTQDETKADKLCPQEIDRLKKENRQVDEGERLATDYNNCASCRWTYVETYADRCVVCYQGSEYKDMY